MSAENNHLAFEPLPLKKRVFADVDPQQYSVLSVSGESREIKAGTAYEAFRLSGLKDAIKIERSFNSGKNIIEKSKLADPVPMQAATVAVTGHDAHARMVQLKSAVISADELDELMRLFREEAALKQQNDVTAEASLVPEPEAAAVSGTPSPMGMDIHGDGFDEIIPSTAPVKPPAPLKSPEHKEEAAASAPSPATELPPERELSVEEVAKLLGEPKP